MGSLRVQFTADDTVKTALEEIQREHSSEFRIEKVTAESDPVQLGFDIVTIASIATVVQSAFYLGELAVRIANAVPKMKGNKIVVTTPLGAIEIARNDTLTADEVRELLRKIAEL